MVLHCTTPRAHIDNPCGNPPDILTLRLIADRLHPYIWLTVTHVPRAKAQSMTQKPSHSHFPLSTLNHSTTTALLKKIKAPLFAQILPLLCMCSACCSCELLHPPAGGQSPVTGGLSGAGTAAPHCHRRATGPPKLNTTSATPSPRPQPRHPVTQKTMLRCICTLLSGSTPTWVCV